MSSIYIRRQMLAEDGTLSQEEMENAEWFSWNAFKQPNIILVRT